MTLTANGTGANDLSGSTPVDSDGTLQADTWTLSETGPAGYTASAWVCVGGTQAPADRTRSRVGIGGEATCTITNDDIAPKLHLRKAVINDNGGDAATRLDPDRQRHRRQRPPGSTPVDSAAAQADT